MFQGNADRAWHVLTSGLESSGDGSGFVSIRPTKKKKGKKNKSQSTDAAGGLAPVTPIAVATARRAYNRVREQATAAGGLGLGCAVHAVVCHGLLELLSAAGFNGMRSVFDRALAELYDPDGQHPVPTSAGAAGGGSTAGSNNSVPLLSVSQHRDDATRQGNPRRLADGCEALYAAYVKYAVAHFAGGSGGGTGGGGGKVGGVLVSPRVVRDILLRALDAFPGNASFLSCWLLVEGTSQIAANLRAFFHSHCRSSAPGGSEPALWLFAAHFEARRALSHSNPVPASDDASASLAGGSSGGGVGVSTSSSASSAAVLRVINLYERAVACPEIQHSPVLWSAYLSFLLQRYTQLQAMVATANVVSSSSEIEDAALGAKRVFFRAIRACGEAKSLWLAAFTVPALRGLMSKAELAELNELMIEKELRIHVDLDEVVLPFFSLS